MVNEFRTTAAFAQWRRFKEKHPGCLLMFRLGDFYEMFDQDALDASKSLGLTLTQRPGGVAMAGIPHHQLETYLKRLIQRGFRVAVCELTEQKENQPQPPEVARRAETGAGQLPLFGGGAS